MYKVYWEEETIVESVMQNTAMDIKKPLTVDL
jgi:hypothetical protein